MGNSGLKCSNCNARLSWFGLAMAMLFIINVTAEEYEFSEVEVSSHEASLISENHSSEGSLLTMGNQLMHIFRLTRFGGNHVSNDGAVAIRSSDDGGLTWDRAEILVDGEYDQRNARSGIINEHIITFFRTYDANSMTPINLQYIVGTEQGKVWTAPRIVPFVELTDDFYEMWIDNPQEIDDGMLFTLHAVGFFQIWKAEISPSLEIVNARPIYTLDYRDSQDYSGIDEPELLQFSDGKLLVVFRNDSVERYSRSFLAMTSIDGGSTFSPIFDTKLCAPDFSKAVAPHLIKSDAEGGFILLGSYRDYFYTFEENSENLGSDKMCLSSGIISSEGEVILGDESFIERPLKGRNGLYSRMYGYPVSAYLDESSWLVIFTDSMQAAELGVEQAHLFQFELSIVDKGAGDMVSNLVSSLNIRTQHPEVIVADSGDDVNIENIYNISDLSVRPFSEPLSLKLTSSIKAGIKNEWLDSATSNLISLIIDDVQIDESVPDYIYDFNEDGVLSSGDALTLSRIRTGIAERATVIPLFDKSVVIKLNEREDLLEFLRFRGSVSAVIVGDILEEFAVFESDICPVFSGLNSLVMSPGEPITLSSMLSAELAYDKIFTLETSHNELIDIREVDDALVSAALPDSEYVVTSIGVSYSSRDCSDAREYAVILLSSDLDSDSRLNKEDADIDGDGFINSVDALFWDASNWSDLDHDGVGDQGDLDLDNDGILNDDDDDDDGDGKKDEIDWNPLHRSI